MYRFAFGIALAVVSAATAAAQQINIGITQNHAAIDSYQTTYERVFTETVARMPDVSAIILDAEGQVDRQIAQMAQLIEADLDVIIIWPTQGEAVMPAVRDAHAAGIPVVVTNSPVIDSAYRYIRAYSGPDNVQEGIYAAEMMCEALNGAGRVVEISGLPGYITATERRKGFEYGILTQCPDVEILETRPANWNRPTAQRVMERFLEVYDEIDGVYSADDNMGFGALTAAREAGRADEMVFVGATNFGVGYDAIAEGAYYGSVYQSPVEDARLAIEVAVRIAQGEDVPVLNHFETPKITRENLDRFPRPVF